MGVRHSHASHSKRNRRTANDQRPQVANARMVSAVAPVGAKSVLTAIDEGTTCVTSWQESRQLYEWQAHPKDITQVAVDSTGSTIATASRDCTIRLWRHEHVQKPVGELVGHDLVVTAIDFSKVNPTVLCSGSRDGAVAIWDVTRARKQTEKHTNRNLVTGVKWLHSEPVFIQSSEDKALRMWDSRANLTATAFMTTNHIHRCCDVNGDDSMFITGSGGFAGDGCMIMEWDRRVTSMPLNVLTGHKEGINTCIHLTVKFVKSQNVVSMHASGSQDGEIVLWRTGGSLANDTSVDQLAARLLVGCGPVLSLAQVGESTICAGTFSGGAAIIDIVENSDGTMNMNIRNFF